MYGEHSTANSCRRMENKNRYLNRTRRQFSTAPSEALDESIGFQTAEDQVEEPQADKAHWRYEFWIVGTSQLAGDAGYLPPHHKCGDGKDRKHTEHRHREAKVSWIHLKGLVVYGVVDSSDSPCYTDTQENVYCVAPSNIAHAGICILVTNSCCFAGKCVCVKTKKWTSDKLLVVDNIILDY